MIEYRIENKPSFKIMGKGCHFTYDEAFDCIPQMWGKWMSELKDCPDTGSKMNVGKYGISIETPGDEKDFVYYIAGDYSEGLNTEGYEIVTIPEFTWVIFNCVGPMPEAMQTLQTQIFNEWFDEERPYEIAAGYNVECYEMGDSRSSDYKSEIWIPVKEKK